DLDVAHWQAASFENGKSVSLCVIDVDWLTATLGSIEPIATSASKRCCATANTASHTALLLRLIAFIGARHFKECHITVAARCVALSRCQKPRQKRWAHIRHVGGDWVGKLERSSELQSRE